MPKFLVKEPFQLKNVLRQAGEVVTATAEEAQPFVERGGLRQVDRNLKQIPLPEPQAQAPRAAKGAAKEGKTTSKPDSSQENEKKKGK